MKLNREDNNVTSNGVKERQGFTIEVNAKTFKMWSDSLYQDKIGSIVRELSCNAADAHIEAGIPQKPFTIHVPNVVEPWFSVKDEGIGISKKDMFEIFKAYGKSTKEDSNEGVGCYGIGSKTPFSYTDQFTIVSVHNGIRSTYMAIKDNGLPDLRLYDEQETDEHPSFEVSIAVNNDDFYKFEKAIVKQLMFFPVKPILENNMNNVQFPDINQNIFLQNEKITMYQRSWNNPFDGVMIVQGGVGYPLNPDHLGELNSQTAEFINELESNGAYMEFPIGSIEVSPSREVLSYEDETIQNIINRIEDVANEICTEAMEKVRNASTLWERVIIYNEEMKLVKIALQNSPEFGSWFEGTLIDTKFGNMSVDTEKFHELGYKISFMNMDRNRNGNYSLTKKTVGDNYYHRYNREIVLHPKENMKLFIRDTTKKPIVRVREYCNNHDEQVLLIESTFGKTVEDDAIKSIADSLGLPESHIYKISDVPAPKNVSTGTGQTGPRAKGFMYSWGEDSLRSKDWTNIMDLDDLDNGVYVEMDRHNIEFNDYSQKDYITVIKASARNIINMPVIAVNKRTYQRIKDGKVGTNLVSVDNVVGDLNQTIQDFQPLINNLKKYKGFIRQIENSVFEKILELYDNGSSIISKINSVKTRIEQLESRIGIYQIFFESSYYHDDVHKRGMEKANEKIEKLFQHYPMLEYVGLHRLHREEDMQTVINYMKMVDGA